VRYKDGGAALASGCKGRPKERANAKVRLEGWESLRELGELTTESELWVRQERENGVRSARSKGRVCEGETKQKGKVETENECKSDIERLGERESDAETHEGGGGRERGVGQKSGGTTKKGSCRVTKAQK